MGIILHGTEDFEFKLTTVGPRVALEELSRASLSGSLYFVVDSYEVKLEDGTEESVYLESLEELLGLDEDPERGFYESSDFDTDPAEILAALWAGEREHAEALGAYFEERAPVSVEVYANVLFRFYEDDWDAMLAYLNEHMPDEAPLTMKEVAGFDLDTLLRFTPGKDEPQRADGTGVVLRFHVACPGVGLALLGLAGRGRAAARVVGVVGGGGVPLYQEVLWRREAEDATS